MDKILFLGGAVIALAVLGCACLFRTTALVEWSRKDYRRSGRFVQAWPGANIVMQSWFPMYLRGMGVFALLISILVASDIFQMLQQ